MTIGFTNVRKGGNIAMYYVVYLFEMAGMVRAILLCRCSLADTRQSGDTTLYSAIIQYVIFVVTTGSILPVIDRRTMADAAKETMSRLDFHVDRLDAPVGRFSGGQRQAVAIGRAMYWNARVILMDEPTAALGVPEQRKVLALIRNLKAQGRGVIFISHNLQDIFAVSDRIVILRRGSLAGERLIAQTTHDEVVKLMIGG